MDEKMIGDNKNCQIFEPTGWLDTNNSQKFESQLIDVMSNGTKYLVIDCSELDYISSAGFRILLNIAKHITSLQGMLVLCSLEEYVEEVIEMSGLYDLFPIARNLDEALGKVRSITT